jgi:hypothetical protein
MVMVQRTIGLYHTHFEICPTEFATGLDRGEQKYKEPGTIPAIRDPRNQAGAGTSYQDRDKC